MKKEYSFSEILNLTTIDLMKKYKNIVVFGLGVDDPKRIFGTTKGLVEKFGSHRVFDMPASENAMTGFGIGMSLNGYLPIMIHQRMDFFLLAIDQLINNAAKWKYMFGGQAYVKIIIRLIIGRGWGQGPTHSQNFQNLFAGIPGLKVFLPSFPSTARSLLVDAISSKDPVIFIEHRWLHNIKEKINLKIKLKKTEPIAVLKKGNDITIVSFSYSTIEIKKIYKVLSFNRISFEHLDINIIKPLKIEKIYNSVKKTGRLLLLDNSSHAICSVSNDIISQLVIKDKNIFKKSPITLLLPEIPSPSSFYLTKSFYHSSSNIIKNIEILVNKKIKFEKKIDFYKYHDIPDSNFSGPF